MSLALISMVVVTLLQPPLIAQCTLFVCSEIQGFVLLLHHMYCFQICYIHSASFETTYYIGSQAGAASLVEGRPVLHHFKLWREAALRVNFNA